MRGEIEKECFDIIVKKIFYTEKGICKDFDGKTYKDVSEKEFKFNWIFYVSDYLHDHSFGLLEEDRIEISEIFRKAKENPQSSEFPDFVFDKGFIEQFKITSSKTTSKGATQIREEKNFKQKVDSETKIIEEEWSKAPSNERVRSKYWDWQQPTHSYEFLVESFKSNWESHIKSLNNYTGNKEIGIFIVEYSEFALFMSEKIIVDWIDGMSAGDLIPEIKHFNYRLSRDKDLLDYVYTFKDKLKYVCFVHIEGVEIIKIESIPYLKKLMPYDYQVSPICVRGVSATHYVNIQNDMEENYNDKT